LHSALGHSVREVGGFDAEQVREAVSHGGGILTGEQSVKMFKTGLDDGDLERGQHVEGMKAVGVDGHVIWSGSGEQGGDRSACGGGRYRETGLLYPWPFSSSVLVCWPWKAYKRVTRPWHEGGGNHKGDAKHDHILSPGLKLG